MTHPGPPPGALLRLVLAASLLIPVSVAAADEPPPTLAAALRIPGPVLVADCGEGRPHQVLADKVAGDLRALRGETTERAWCGDLDALHWEDAHLVLITSDARDPAVVGVAGELGLRVDDAGLEVAGITLTGTDAGAVLTLPHPRDPDRWALVLVGTGPDALRRLDRHIRNDVAASALLLDDSGERMADLIPGDHRWSVPDEHPYRAEEVVGRAAGWVADAGARVAGWTATVGVDPDAGIVEVTCRVEIERGVRRPPEDIWLLLNPRAEVRSCTGRGVTGCARFDARDGTVRLHVIARRSAPAVELTYRLPLEERLEAWYVGPRGGYLMPEANWLPRVRGGPDEAYADVAPQRVTLEAPGAAAVPIPGDAGRAGTPGPPVLVWGEYREVELDGGARAFVAPHAPDAVPERAAALLDALARWRLVRPVPRAVVAVDRPRAWIGSGLLLVPPDLLEPGPVDERTHLALERAATEQLARLQPPGGRPLRVEGALEVPEVPVTVRLWQARGTWWEQLDEGPVDADGRFDLDGVGRLPLMVSAEADGAVPAFVAAEPGVPVAPVLRPVDAVALVCLRCGPDLGAVRYPMVEIEPGWFAVDVALGELHRRYGAFPYAFELSPGEPTAALVLDASRPPDQFPSFLSPEEFHADVAHFELHVDDVRFWIEVPGGLLAPAAWITPEGGAPAIP